MENLSLKTKHPFSFPFKPYGIQENFMNALYSVIENCGIGIFESPTGTGKSLSLICGSMTWLHEYNKKIREECRHKIDLITSEIAKMEVEAAGTADWIESESKVIKKKSELVVAKKEWKNIEDYDKEMVELKNKEKKRKKNKTKFKSLINRQASIDEDEGITEDSSGIDDLLLNEYDDEKVKELEIEDLQNYKPTKVYFCSRTHSQLSQVVGEIKSTAFGETTMVVPLGSRQLYCINPSVKNLKSNAAINEKCLDLQKSKSTSTKTDADGNNVKKKKTQSSKCPCNSSAKISQLRDQCLSEVLDIEDLVTESKHINACPYYASRQAVADADLILLPYQMLFHKRTRKQMKIDVKNSIVIVDEAHNILDTITSMHSSEITLEQLVAAHGQLLDYKKKYFSRFSTRVVLKINQLVFMANRLIKLIQKIATVSKIMSLPDFMEDAGFSNINLFEMLDFCEQTRLSQKVQGFYLRNFGKNSEIIDENHTKSFIKLIEEKRKPKKTKDVPIVEEKVDQPQPTCHTAVRGLLKFIESLTEVNADGRILYSSDDETKQKRLKYLPLNPSYYIDDVLNECRAFIVAGGTMQPTNEFTQQLFWNHKQRISEHFFDHVIPKESILPIAISRGPGNTKFLFNFANRNDHTMLLELSMTLTNVCNVVPAGVICFFGSYDYMEHVYKFLKDNQQLSRIEKNKKVFKEPRTSHTVEKVLQEYSLAANNKLNEGSQTGALLFSVIGGKLSEGLNFGDDLGRCVLVVGLPYPNRNSPELMEKMKFIDASIGPGNGQQYYQNLCMKAVNQCIGRAVRHIRDYACVLLLDERYLNTDVEQKLPGWIGRVLKKASNFGMVQRDLVNFFKEKKAS